MRQWSFYLDRGFLSDVPPERVMLRVTRAFHEPGHFSRGSGRISVTRTDP